MVLEETEAGNNRAGEDQQQLNRFIQQFLKV
jgi:hypothetical protein